MMNPNLLQLLMAGQAGQGGPTASGPIPAQNPTPGFRPPAAMGMAMPGMPQQNDSTLAGGLGMLSGALAGMQPGKGGIAGTGVTPGTMGSGTPGPNGGMPIGGIPGVPTADGSIPGMPASAPSSPDLLSRIGTYIKGLF